MNFSDQKNPTVWAGFEPRIPSLTTRPIPTDENIPQLSSNMDLFCSSDHFHAKPAVKTESVKFETKYSRDKSSLSVEESEICTAHCYCYRIKLYRINIIRDMVMQLNFTHLPKTGQYSNHMVASQTSWL